MYITQTIHWILLIIFVWALAQAWRSSQRTETTQPIKAFGLLLIYYASYLLFPWIILTVWQWYRTELTHIQAISYLLIAMVLIYARFIEPSHIVVKETHLVLDQQKPLSKPVKVALIADLHIGLYSGREQQLQLIVNKINAQKPDFVVVAGDWTYEPENKLATELSVLTQIQCPVYSVNGNHDEQYPGPPIQALLANALKVNKVLDIENQIVEFEDFRLLGIGDLWAGKVNLEVLSALPQDKPWVILAHNPDTVAMVPQLSSKPLMLSGHTHGGQIELPWLTSYVMKKISMLGHKRGFYEHETANVYVTVGTGMVGAPFRFRVPPTVDILHLH
ncbi:phosphohydrolase [Acinetobacter qingfengensis]|uniref:Phosphohydrolase n=1 Tax=Acinetobacter qingfengensis TaxID=1262585 RepID=A0A1E7RF59_9GAMM|nr:metallophosphoesterase [Acinetobacter qingfengensis]KAA8731873.1 phosphohydrolase [Acinetobacter qingfengensis]OEY98004.1 phosphohydrolase [Acinetobacter qingfengensis]